MTRDRTDNQQAEDPAPISPDQMWVRLRAGDQTVLEELYREHAERLRRFFQGGLLDRDEAEDCVHEVFTRAATAATATDAKEVAELRPWLWGIAKNVRSGRNKVAAGTRSRLADHPVEVAADQQPHEERGFDSYGKWELVAAVWEVIECLPRARQALMKTIIKLRGPDADVPSAAVAKELGPDWTATRVDRELSRARAQIRVALGVLAVARGIRSCTQAVSCVHSPSLHGPVRYAQISAADRSALTSHANPDSCKSCHLVFRNAGQSSEWALGPAGLLLLSTYLDGDDDERRRAILALWSHAPSETAALSGSATTVVTIVPTAALAGQPPAGLLKRVANSLRSVTDAATRQVLTLPGFSEAAQAIQNIPTVARAIAAVATVIVVAFLTASHHPKTTTSPPAATIATFTAMPSPKPAAPQAEAPHPSTSAVAPPPTTEPSTNPPAPTPTSSQPPTTTTTPPAPTPTPSASTTAPPPPPPPPSTFPIAINASATSYVNIAISDDPTWKDAHTEQHFSLPPGTHQLRTLGGPSIPFDVTAAGRIDYDPKYDPIFTGRGTTTLAVHGTARITANITDTSYTAYSIAGNYTGRDRSPELVLVPGPHGIGLDGRFGWIQFDVTTAGRIDYDPKYDPIFTGRGTTALAVHGLPITIDARSATFASFSIPGVTGPVDARQLHTFSLLPGTHQVVPSAGATIAFSMTTAGNVDYDASLDDILDGRGTPTLLFRGPTLGLLLLFVLGGCSFWHLAGLDSPLLLTVGLVDREAVSRRIRTRPRRTKARLICIPARLIRHSRGLTLRPPPGHPLLAEILTRIRALPTPTQPPPAYRPRSPTGTREP